MSVITWRNVAAPDLRGTSKILDSASNSINQGTNQLTSAVDSYAARDKKDTEANIQSFVDSFKTEGDYNTALNDGSLSTDALDKAFGSNYDKTKIEGLVNNRLGTIRTKNTADFNYQKVKTAQNDDPKLQALTSQILAAGNDQNALAAIKASIGDSGFINPNQALQSANNAISKAVGVQQSTQDRAQTLLTRQRTNADYRSKAEKEKSAAVALDAQLEADKTAAANPSTKSVNANDPTEIAAQGALDKKLISAGESSVTGGDLLPVVQQLRKDKYELPNGSKIDYPASILNAAFDSVNDSSFFDVNQSDFLDVLNTQMTKYVEGLTNTQLNLTNQNDVAKKKLLRSFKKS